MMPLHWRSKWSPRNQRVFFRMWAKKTIPGHIRWNVQFAWKVYTNRIFPPPYHAVIYFVRRASPQPFGIMVFAHCARNQSKNYSASIYPCKLVLFVVLNIFFIPIIKYTRYFFFQFIAQSRLNSWTPVRIRKRWPERPVCGYKIISSISVKTTYPYSKWNSTLLRYFYKIPINFKILHQLQEIIMKS